MPVIIREYDTGLQKLTFIVNDQGEVLVKWQIYPNSTDLAIYANGVRKEAILSDKTHAVAEALRNEWLGLTMKESPNYNRLRFDSCARISNDIRLRRAGAEFHGICSWFPSVTAAPKSGWHPSSDPVPANASILIRGRNGVTIGTFCPAGSEWTGIPK
jgi:hypothetical protein